MEKPQTKQWDSVLNRLDPLARALFGCHAWLEPISPYSPKIFVEMRNSVLLRIGEYKRTELEQAFKQELNREISLCLYTLEPLKALTKLAVSDGQGD